MTDSQLDLGPEIKSGYGDLVKETAEGDPVWVRIPAKGATPVVLLRDEPARYTSHWNGYRYQPCPGFHRCGYCQTGKGKKERYVYAVYDMRHKRPGLIEVGPQTAAEIKAITDKARVVRGIEIVLRKEGSIVNGAITATYQHGFIDEKELPPGPDPAYVLRKQWSMPERERID